MIIKEQKTLPWLLGILIGIALSAAFVAGYMFQQSNHGTQEKFTGQTPGPLIQNPLAANNKTGNILLAENTIADIAQNVSDSVVNIDISSSVSIPDNQFSPFMPFRNFDFFLDQVLVMAKHLHFHTCLTNYKNEVPARDLFIVRTATS